MISTVSYAPARRDADRVIRALAGSFPRLLSCSRSARIAVMESDEGPMVCLRKDPRRAPYRQGAGPDEKSIKKATTTL